MVFEQNGVYHIRIVSVSYSSYRKGKPSKRRAVMPDQQFPSYPFAGFKKKVYAMPWYMPLERRPYHS